MPTTRLEAILAVGMFTVACLVWHLPARRRPPISLRLCSLRHGLHHNYRHPVVDSRRQLALCDLQGVWQSEGCCEPDGYEWRWLTALSRQPVSTYALDNLRSSRDPGQWKLPLAFALAMARRRRCFPFGRQIMPEPSVRPCRKLTLKRMGTPW